VGAPWRIVIGVVLLVAGLLRFWALDGGVPYAVGVDEPAIMNRAFQIMRTGDFNPHFFDYGGLYIYMQVAVASARFMAGAVDGLWRSLDQVGPDQFYVWARALTAALGTATVALLVLVGRRWGSSQALLAASLLAVMPHHVRESHYVLTDVPITFFVTLTLLLSLRAHELKAAGALAWAGVAAGLAASVKYPAGLALLMPLAVIGLTPAPRSARGSLLLVTLAAFAAAFLAGSPYTVLDLPGFLTGFANLPFRPRAPDMESGWITYLKHLRIGMGWPGVLLVAAGVASALVGLIRGPDRVRWVLVLLFPLVFMDSISGRGRVFARYMLPVVPFACLLASIGLHAVVGVARRVALPQAVRIGLPAALAVAVLLPPAVAAIDFDRTMAKRSTAALAYDWITEHVPEEASLLVERAEVRLPARIYRSENVTFLTEYGYERMRQDGIGYLVASSQSYGQVMDQPQLHPEEYAAYRTIFDRAEELVRFSPTDDHPGPELRVYRLP
jgi:4-amino-4-deoxy-L-arabinose transferase-like glycosyltransferase